MKKQTGPDQELHIPMSEKLKSIPEIFGIRVNEEPAYEVLKKDGDFEVRSYKAQLWAEVSLKGLPLEEFKETAFKKLAGYIFGGNELKEEIAMTSPVLQQSHDENDATNIPMTAPVFQKQDSAGVWTMSFVLPAKFNLANVPKPVDSDVHLKEVAPYQVAALRYSGTNSFESLKEHQAKLAAWMNTQPQLSADGEYFSAQYDGPFVIPFLRRNEALVKVRPQQ